MIELAKDLLFTRPDGSSHKSKIVLCYDYQDDDHSDFLDILHRDELEKYKSLPSIKAKNNFLLGRFCAKKAIDSFAKINHPSEILVTNGVFGQPIIHHPSINNLQVSIAHSDKMAIAVVFEERHPVAIDIEEIKDSWSDEILSQTFTDAELAISRGLNIEQNIFYFILWTAKEGLAKILKTGFTAPPILFEIETISSKSALRAEFYSTYRNFGQYRAFSYLISGHICSLIFPKNSKIS